MSQRDPPPFYREANAEEIRALGVGTYVQITGLCLSQENQVIKVGDSTGEVDVAMETEISEDFEPGSPIRVFGTVTGDPSSIIQARKVQSVKIDLQTLSQTRDLERK